MKFITVKEMANTLNVCTKTILKMIREGKIKAVEISGEKRITYRIYEREIDRIMAENYERTKSVHHSAESVHHSASKKIA